MKTLLALLISMIFYSTVLIAQEATETTPALQPGKDCEQAETVFQDVSGMGRKDRAAKNMTKRHAEMAKDGWRFIGLAVYTENGDLEGFFLSYTRAVVCPLRAANG